MNTQGMITETTIANIFFVEKDVVYTAPIDDGVLPGVMRSNVIDLCHELQIPIEIQSLKLEDIAKANGVFLTNSLMSIQSVCQIENNVVDTNCSIIDVLKHYISKLIYQK